VSAANNHRSERDWLRLIVWSGTAILVLGVVVLLRTVGDQREGLSATAFSDVFFVSGLMAVWLFGLVSASLGAGVMLARRIRWTKKRDSMGWRAMIVGSALLVLGLYVCIVFWPGPLLARHQGDGDQREGLAVSTANQGPNRHRLRIVGPGLPFLFSASRRYM
jgi:hypothetical protein